MQTFLKIDMDDDIESTSEEVDALLDYMDERVEQGVQPEEIMAAIVVVLALISGEAGDAETLH
jgi:glycerol-3-phosphate dehydrogenase